jgi:menaquinone-dependent protoporphyrinogen oxidase
MKVLIVTASKYGSTVGVGAAIAETLRARGHHTDAHEAAAAPAPTEYDAVVVGSGVYMGSWLKAAATYLETHAAALAERPVWLFGVGPLGAENPQPAGDPEGATKLVALVGAQGYVTFTGALDRSRLGFADRLIARAVKAPDGDFRDWAAIRAWTEGVADVLETGALAGTSSSLGQRTEGAHA